MTDNICNLWISFLTHIVHVIQHPHKLIHLNQKICLQWPNLHLIILWKELPFSNVRGNPLRFFIFFWAFGRTVGIHGNNNSLTINLNCQFSVIWKSMVINIMSLRPFFWRQAGEEGAWTSPNMWENSVKLQEL